MPTDIAKIKEQLANMTQLGFTVYKPVYGPSKDKPTENRLKLFSFPASGGPLAKRVLKHFNLGADGRQQVVCPKTFGINHQCPICDFCAAATRSEDPALIERVKKIRQTERFMQIVADWNVFEKEKKRVVAIYDCPPMVHRSIMQTMASQEHDFTDWKSALVVLSCYATGPMSPKRVDFGIAMHNMAPQIVELDPKDWLPLMPDTETLFRAPSLERLQKLLEGEEDTGEESGDTETASGGAAEDPDWTVAEQQGTAAAAKAEATTAQAQPATVATQPAAPTEAAKPKMSLKDLVEQAKKRSTPAA